MAEKKFLYIWKGDNDQGRVLEGELLAPSQPMLRAQLSKQNIRLISARKKMAFEEALKKKISEVDITLFTRQMATLLRAGIDIVRALDLASKDQKKIQLQRMLTAMRMSVEGGQTLSDSMRAYPQYFDGLYCSLMEAGEQAGAIEMMFTRIAQYREKSMALRKKVKRALTYPIIILVVALIVILIFLGYIIPAFDDLFSSFGAELPYLTRKMMVLSEQFRAHWVAFFGTLFASILAYRWLKQHYLPFRHLLDRLMLKAPIFGNLMHKFVIARFSRTLSTSYSAGLPLVESLVSVANTSGNYVYQKAILKVHEQVSAGEFIHQAMRRQPTLFPNLAIQMMSVGEESGKLDETISRLADIYEEDVDEMVENLTQLIEPVVMVMLGVIVCVLVLAMYMPIFNLGAAIR